MSNIHQRFHVGSDSIGFDSAFPNFKQAMERACHCARRDGHVFTIFDSMARFGAWQTWHAYPNKDVEPIDYRH